MNNPFQPIFILPEGMTKSSGMKAQKINIEAAKQVAEQVRTTLGPKGMDKMIVDAMGDVIITNDGVTILKEMTIEHPSAKMIVEVAKTQEDEVGDGTTTVVVLAGELLKNSQDLLEKGIHPTIIVKGFRLAENKAQEILNDMAMPISIKDTDILKKIAQTAMTGKGAEQAKELLSELIVKAVINISEVLPNPKKGEKDSVFVDIDNIKIEKKVGSSVEESKLIDGIIIDKERIHSGMPKKINNAKILLINSALEIKNTEIDAKIQITDPLQMQSFLDQEEAMIKKMANKIISTGANVILCQKGIDDLMQHYLSKAGIFAARRVKISDMQKLSMATGATIVNTIDEITEKDIGYAGNVEERKIGEDSMIFIQECKNPKSVTLLVRGGTSHVVDEVKRAVDDALGVLAATLNVGKIITGAGSSEIELAMKLKKFSESLSGREQLAVEAFANSMEIIPRTLSENAGLDPIDIITALKEKHDKGIISAGIDVFEGKIKDAYEMGVIEPLKIKTQAVSSATEVAMMILRIDDVISSEPMQKASPDAPMNNMPPGM